VVSCCMSFSIYGQAKNRGGIWPDGARKSGKVIVTCYHFCQMECGSNNVVVATTLYKVVAPIPGSAATGKHQIATRKLLLPENMPTTGKQGKNHVFPVEGQGIR
jgi:hypothetical protein